MGSTTPGNHGGRLIELKKTGATWGSNYSTMKLDLQGDPRWFEATFGQKTAQFFGYNMLNPNKMQIPDAKEFNGALKKLNKSLSANGFKQIAIHFYNQSSAKMKDYHNIFAANFGLPVSPDHNHLIHDMSFHTAAIMLSPRMIKYAAARAFFTEKFIEFIEDRHPKESPHHDEIKKTLHEIRLDTAERIDAATAVPSRLFSYVDPSTKASDKEHKWSLGFVQSSLIPAIGSKSMRSRIAVYAEYTAIDTGLFSAGLMSDEQRILRQFTKLHRHTQFQGLSLDNSYFDGQDSAVTASESIYNDLLKRRQEINISVEALVKD